jgi:hypothetical protein
MRGLGISEAATGECPVVAEGVSHDARFPTDFMWASTHSICHDHNVGASIETLIDLFIDAMRLPASCSMLHVVNGHHR